MALRRPYTRVFGAYPDRRLRVLGSGVRAVADLSDDGVGGGAGALLGGATGPGCFRTAGSTAFC